MKVLLYVGAAYHLAFALFHLGFWKLFRWQDELPKLGFINRNIMQILNLCLTFIFLAIAWISFVHADALSATALGRTLLIVIALFWLLRAFLQAFYFGIKDMRSFAFLLVFVAGATLYLVPFISRV